MGEFDKNQPPTQTSADARRKQILVGVLGAVLLGVLGFHFLSGSPESARAGGTSGTESESAAPAAAQSPADELRDLRNDPTANLLTGGAADAESTKPAHDPFRLADIFRVVTKNDNVKPVETTHVDSRPTEYVPEIPVIPQSSLRIEVIFRVGSKLQGIVNGQIVRTGDTVGDARIVDIQSDRVVVRHKDYPDGPTTTALFLPKPKAVAPPTPAAHSTE